MKESDIDRHAQLPACQPPASEQPASPEQHPQLLAIQETNVIEQLLEVDDSLASQRYEVIIEKDGEAIEVIVEKDYDAEYPVTEGLLFDGYELPPAPEMFR